VKLGIIAIAFLLLSSTAAAHSVVLHWDYGTTPGITFNVYRNGYRIATGVTLHKYKDGHPKTGKNNYYVTAVEGGVESQPSSVFWIKVP
jgi:hypothetical protein